MTVSTAVAVAATSTIVINAQHLLIGGEACPIIMICPGLCICICQIYLNLSTSGSGNVQSYFIDIHSKPYEGLHVV